MRLNEASFAALGSETLSRDDASAVSDALHRALEASGDDQCWLLIDPTIRPLDENDPLTRALKVAGAEVHSLTSPHRGIDDSVMPRIALLNSARPSGSAALRQSIEEAIAECRTDALTLGGGRRIGGWVQTNATQAAVAHHIARRMLQRRPDGRTTLLRWTDPAVLWVIWSVLDIQQKVTLLGPISHYHLLDPAGRLLTLDAQDLEPLYSASSMNDLALISRQWQMLDAVGPLNLALLQHHAAGLANELLCLARDDGLAALLRAQALGFADTRDLAAFAWRALTVHRRFDVHPLVAERLVKRQGDDYFTALVGDLGDVEWSRIARELNEERA